MKWIDLLIEYTRFGQRRDERQVKISTMIKMIEKVDAEMQKREEIVVMMQKTYDEQPALIA